MAKGKVTSSRAATSASKTLSNEATGGKSKTAAGSALSQTAAPKKTTSKKAGSAASSVVRDKRTSKTSKTAAGSALSQVGGKKSSTGRTVKTTTNKTKGGPPAVADTHKPPRKQKK
jgi:hypothetical protein